MTNDTITDNDYTETVRLHDHYEADDGTVTAYCDVTVVDFGNNRVSLRVTDPATGKATWVWMTSADALMLGGALTTAGGVAGRDWVEDNTDEADAAF